MGALTVLNTLLMAVEERAAEIGVSLGFLSSALFDEVPTVAATIALGILASAYPVWRSIAVPPAQALRRL